jgi:hypothetical protein
MVKLTMARKSWPRSHTCLTDRALGVSCAPTADDVKAPYSASRRSPTGKAQVSQSTVINQLPPGALLEGSPLPAGRSTAARPPPVAGGVGIGWPEATTTRCK